MVKFAIILTCLSLFSIQACTQPQDMPDLSDYQWKNRLVLIFAPTPEAEPYQQLISQIEKDQPQLIDRDIKVFHFLEEGQSYVGDQTINATNTDEIRQEYRIQQGKTTVVLIGKDGGEKKRQMGTEIDLKSLYTLIDSMPMRRREMRENQQKEN